MKVIAGMEAAVKSMKVGGIRRVIIPPSQGYQNTSQEPIPPNVRTHSCFPLFVWLILIVFFNLSCLVVVCVVLYVASRFNRLHMHTYNQFFF